MKIERLSVLWFSPTGSTRRVCLTLGQTLGRRLALVPETVDITFPSLRRQKRTFGPGDLVTLGTPTYAGRVPNLIVPRLRETLLGEGALAIPAVTFGNRSFDDAAGELAALLTENGFCVIGAAAVAARHSFTDELGSGRPDGGDLDAVRAFADRIADRLLSTETPVPVSVPCPGGLKSYYTPLRADGTPARFLRAKPRVDTARCEGCCFCADICPMGAIDRADPTQTPGTCIKCQACVRRCPAHARFFDDADFLSHVAMLRSAFSRPAASVFFE